MGLTNPLLVPHVVHVLARYKSVSAPGMPARGMVDYKAPLPCTLVALSADEEAVLASKVCFPLV